MTEQRYVFADKPMRLRDLFAALDRADPVCPPPVDKQVDKSTAGLEELKHLPSPRISNGPCAQQ